ncbi:hypothetical protein J4474_03370 [Candidatus Pacearchaeota archaeon]|nr:hypothetical protein [Candidatus Pacearchaeota archaeon]
MKKYFLKELSGGILFLVGIILILNSFSEITGFAVVGNINFTEGSILGIVLIIAGIYLFAVGNLEKNLGYFEKGAVITDPRKLKKIAKRIGYNGREVKEGYQILNEKGKPVTVIPRHISKGVYFNIREALLTGQSNFRKDY